MLKWSIHDWNHLLICWQEGFLDHRQWYLHSGRNVLCTVRTGFETSISLRSFAVWTKYSPLSWCLYQETLGTWGWALSSRDEPQAMEVCEAHFSRIQPPPPPDFFFFLFKLVVFWTNPTKGTYFNKWLQYTWSGGNEWRWAGLNYYPSPALGTIEDANSCIVTSSAFENLFISLYRYLLFMMSTFSPTFCDISAVLVLNFWHLHSGHTKCLSWFIIASAPCGLPWLDRFFGFAPSLPLLPVSARLWIDIAELSLPCLRCLHLGPNSCSTAQPWQYLHLLYHITGKTILLIQYNTNIMGVRKYQYTSISLYYVLWFIDSQKHCFEFQSIVYMPRFSVRG